MKIFLSYKSEDREFVTELRSQLIDWGYATWMDIFDIPKGGYWPDEIDKALNECDVILGIMSPLAVQSRNVKNEWDWAIVYRKPLKLLMYEECYVPMNYISINYISCLSGARGTGLNQLHSALSSETGLNTKNTYSDPYRGYLEKLYERINKFLSQKIVSELKDDTGTPEPLRLEAQTAPDMVSPISERQEELDPLFEIGGLSSENSEKFFREINEAVEYYDGRLLLLGEPGSGKTITLLHAARDAVVYRLHKAAAFSG